MSSVLLAQFGSIHSSLGHVRRYAVINQPAGVFVEMQLCQERVQASHEQRMDAADTTTGTSSDSYKLKHRALYFKHDISMQPS